LQLEVHDVRLVVVFGVFVSGRQLFFDESSFDVELQDAHQRLQVVRWYDALMASLSEDGEDID